MDESSNIPEPDLPQKLVNAILVSAALGGSTDVLIEIRGKSAAVKTRAGGEWKLTTFLPPATLRPSLERLRERGQAEGAESPDWREGEIKTTIEGTPYAFRLVSFQTPLGEALSLRAVDPDGSPRGAELARAACEEAWKRGDVPPLYRKLALDQRISAEDALRAAERRKESGGSLVGTLLEMDLPPDWELAWWLAQETKVPFRLLCTRELPKDAIDCVDDGMARALGVVPFERRERTLVVAMWDAFNVMALDELTFATKMKIEPVITSKSEIDAALEKRYPPNRWM